MNSVLKNDCKFKKKYINNQNSVEAITSA